MADRQPRPVKGVDGRMWADSVAAAQITWREDLALVYGERLAGFMAKRGVRTAIGWSKGGRQCWVAIIPVNAQEALQWLSSRQGKRVRQ